MRRSYVVVLFLVVVGLLAVLLRGRQETHPPLVESGDLSDGVGARVEPAVASINSALAQAEKPILAVPIQRIKVVVKRQLSELDARDKKSMALVNYVLKDAGKPEILSTASISLEDLEVLREIIGQNAKSVDAAEGVLTKHADQVLSEARASLEARLARGETTGLPLQSGENSMRRRHPFEAISSIELAGRRYIVRVHPKDDDRVVSGNSAEPVWHRIGHSGIADDQIVSPPGRHSSGRRNSRCRSAIEFPDTTGLASSFAGGLRPN